MHGFPSRPCCRVAHDLTGMRTDAVASSKRSLLDAKRYWAPIGTVAVVLLAMHFVAAQLDIALSHEPSAATKDAGVAARWMKTAARSLVRSRRIAHNSGALQVSSI